MGSVTLRLGDTRTLLYPVGVGWEGGGGLELAAFWMSE